jgi:hypothetical protein
MYLLFQVSFKHNALAVVEEQILGEVSVAFGIHQISNFTELLAAKPLI